MKKIHQFSAIFLAFALLNACDKQPAPQKKEQQEQKTQKNQIKRKNSCGCEN